MYGYLQAGDRLTMIWRQFNPPGAAIAVRIAKRWGRDRVCSQVGGKQKLVVKE